MFNVTEKPMKIRTGWLLLGAMLSSPLLGGCEMPAEATARARQAAAAGMAGRDAAVTERVEIALRSDAAIQADKIAVLTTKGDVRLTGRFDSQDQIDRVIALVRGVEGVRSIHDELTLSRP
ncbi:MAG: BON domain-containing protein [Pseudomonadota bacterium]